MPLLTHPPHISDEAGDLVSKIVITQKTEKCVKYERLSETLIKPTHHNTTQT